MPIARSRRKAAQNLQNHAKPPHSKTLPRRVNGRESGGEAEFVRRTGGDSEDGLLPIIEAFA
jgi:hypothetical protein